MGVGEWGLLGAGVTATIALVSALLVYIAKRQELKQAKSTNDVTQWLQWAAEVREENKDLKDESVLNESRLKETMTQNEELRRRNDTLEAQNKTLLDTLAKRERQIAGRDREIDRLKTRVEWLTSEVNRLSRQIAGATLPVDTDADAPDQHEHDDDPNVDNGNINER